MQHTAPSAFDLPPCDLAALVLLAPLAVSMDVLNPTGHDSSLPKKRRSLAQKVGFKVWECMSQEPLSLLIRLWITFAAAAAALIIMIWRATMAIIPE